MIRCHLARLMGEHKMRISDVIRETGLSRNTVNLLYKETAQKVDLEALGDCPRIAIVARAKLAERDFSII